MIEIGIKAIDNSVKIDQTASIDHYSTGQSHNDVRKEKQTLNICASIDMTSFEARHISLILHSVSIDFRLLFQPFDQKMK